MMLLLTSLSLIYLVGFCTPLSAGDLLGVALGAIAEGQQRILQRFDELEGRMIAQEQDQEEVRNSLQVCSIIGDQITTLQDMIISRKSRNCKDLLENGKNQSGVYTITPEGFPDGVEVFCDQENDGGGWVVMLRRKRQPNQLDFQRTWAEYASGFGDPNGEIWIGNRVLHALTGAKTFNLRVYATNREGEERTGLWETFSVGSEDSQFTLLVSNYQSSESTLGDALWHTSDYAGHSANGMKFSTRDRDNDVIPEFCSELRGKGGWWYNYCYGANPTAPFHDTLTNKQANWRYWDKNTSTEMGIKEFMFKIRP